MAVEQDDVMGPYNSGYTHEAMHTAYVLLDTWAEHVLDTRACDEYSDVKVAAERAHQAMFDVYQLLGRKLDDEDKDQTD